MKRLLVFLLIAFLSPAWADDLPAVLKTAAVLESDTLKLGDIWENLGAKGETVLAAAPIPGKRIIADARWLAGVAQTYGIKWQPASAFDRIVIERASHTVDMKLVESELREALTMEGVSGSFDFEITNRTSINLTIPAEQGQSGLAIRDVMWDQRAARFTATLEIPAGSPTATRQKISGRIFPITRIPVLNRVISRGTTITEQDIDWITIREDDIRRDLITDSTRLIGLEPRSQVRSGQPVRSNELQRPILVQRNSLVTISLRTPFMSLSAQGRATEDGGKGDVIHVVNLQSKRTFEAVVDGPGSVVVTPNGPIRATNN